MPKVDPREKARRKEGRQKWQGESEAARLARKRERAKARRKMKRGAKIVLEAYRPIEEWDDEELARGRPRDLVGGFRGKKPDWIPAVIYEQAVDTFREAQQGRLRATVPNAISAIEFCLTDDTTDGKGRRVVPVSVKLQAATFAIEHLLGKPTQRVEADISVKLQGILADVMVLPDGSPAIERGVIDADSWEEIGGDSPGSSQ